MAIHQGRWVMGEGLYDHALELPNASVRVDGTSVWSPPHAITHHANAVEILAEGVLFIPVKGVNRDRISRFDHPCGMSQDPWVWCTGIGDHHCHSHHDVATPFRVIGCSLLEGGVKQFIMSGPRLVSTTTGARAAW